MEIGERIRHALTYPIESDESKYRPILLGGLLVLLSPLILPFFAVFGYQLRVYEASINEESRPAFGSVLTRMKEGLVAMLNLIPAFILIGILTSVPFSLVSVGVVSETVAALLSFFLIVVSTFLSPIFLALYVDTRTFKGTYNISRLFRILKNKDYLLEMILFSLLSGVLQIAAGIGSIFIITIPFVVMYVTIVTACYLGDMFRPLLDDTR